jgi:hypothetical protein
MFLIKTPNKNHVENANKNIVYVFKSVVFSLQIVFILPIVDPLVWDISHT